MLTIDLMWISNNHAGMYLIRVPIVILIVLKVKIKVKTGGLRPGLTGDTTSSVPL